MGQDLLLLPGAVVFQGQDDRVGGHLSPKKEKQNTTQHNKKKKISQLLLTLSTLLIHINVLKRDILTSSV